MPREPRAIERTENRRSSRRVFLIALGASVLAAPLAVFAQQKVSRVGYLANAADRAKDITFDAFVAGLRELGWIEGKNLDIRYRGSGGREELFPKLAAEFVREGVDVIVTTGSASTRAAQAATHIIPIVFGSSANPVEQKFVASLTRPGGNVTGLAVLFLELSQKRLQVLKEIFPRASRVARLYSSSNVVTMQPAILSKLDSTAGALGVKLQHIPVARPDDLEAGFAAAARSRVDAITVEGDFPVHRARIAALALKHRLPMMCADGRYADDGALVSYGEDIIEMYRRAAFFVDKILRGAKPAGLPVEQPAKYELVINMKTAKALGIKIPSTILVRADRVIE